MDSFVDWLKRYPLLSLAAVATVASLVMAITGLRPMADSIAGLTTLVAIIWVGAGMVKELRAGHYGLDLLALVAMTACLFVGEQLAALIIVLMLTGGEALEDYARGRATGELSELLKRSPRIAHRAVDETGAHETTDVFVEDIRPGDLMLVRPNELVPVDGILQTEAASFDESSLTGEPMPVLHQPGDEVFSGAVNGPQAVYLRAARASADSQYQQIVRLVRQAQQSRAPFARLADRYALPFTAVSLLIAVIAWIVSGEPARFAQVLVLATPCPLLIAVPIAFMGGMSRASKAGVIVKGGAVLEQLAEARSAAFDKTGTLTGGQPRLVGIRPHEGFTKQELLRLVASAEQYSTHVIAEGIITALHERGLELLPAVDAEEHATNGVSATVDGRRVAVGKPAFIASLAPDTRRLAPKPGHTAAYVSVDGHFAGVIFLADEPRPEAAKVLRWLKEHHVSNQVMLTGDVTTTALAVAERVGIKDVRAELRPGQKVQILAGLTPRPLLMVGDGVNDAPALATADVGVAMGARGSTAAGEAADAVILQDSIAPIADIIQISRYTMRVAKRAIWFGIGLSIALMLVATTGIIPAMLGALLQEVVDLLVIAYALRTLRGPHPVQLSPEPAAAAKPGALTA